MDLNFWGGIMMGGCNFSFGKVWVDVDKCEFVLAECR